jgi:hypothetical protein
LFPPPSFSDLSLLNGHSAAIAGKIGCSPAAAVRRIGKVRGES